MEPALSKEKPGLVEPLPGVTVNRPQETWRKGLGAKDVAMDERQTLRIMGWVIGTVVAAVFVLNAIALAAS